MTALAKYLDGLNGEAPDMARLRDMGVSLKRAIRICQDAAKISSEKNPSSNSLPAVAIAPQGKISPDRDGTEHSKTNSAPRIEPEPPRIVATHVLPDPAPLKPAAKQSGIANMDTPFIVAPKPAPQPAAPAETEPEWAALSQLHELSIHVDSQYSSPGDLVAVGFSKSTAEEVSRAINASRGGYVLPEARVMATASAVAERINRVIANRKEIRK